MRYRLTLVALVALVALTATVPPPAGAQAAGSPLVRASMPNDIGIELLGKAVIYSFQYQRMVAPAVGLEIGLGALGGGSSSDNTTLIFVPMGARLYLIPKDGTLFLTGGTVLASASVNEGPFSGTSTFYGQAGFGFEFRSSGGFLFRGTAYGLFAEGGYFIWPGLSVGYAF